jgi:4-carboxymuconolactone decarboxylase
VAGATDFSARFQEFITRSAWGDVWARPGLERRERSLVTLAALVSVRAEGELAIHVRGAIRNGLTPDEIGEAILHTALYAGLPAANAAFKIAEGVLVEDGLV